MNPPQKTPDKMLSFAKSMGAALLPGPGAVYQTPDNPTRTAVLDRAALVS